MDEYQINQLVDALNEAQANSTSDSMTIFAIVAIWFVASLAMGIVASAIAEHNERKPFLAFLAGFFFGPLGVVAYMIMGESIELRVYLEQKALKELKQKSA
jgi:hypothetical protein